MNERQLREMLAGRAPVVAPPELLAMVEAIPATAAIPTTSRWLPVWRPQRRAVVVGLAALVLLASLLAVVIGSQLITRPPGLPGNGVIVVPVQGTLLVVDPATGETVSSGDQLGVGGLTSLGSGVFGEYNSVHWSPDGRSLAGFNRGDLKIVDVESGRVRTMAKLQGCLLGFGRCDVAYSPDGRWMAVTDGTRLNLVDTATGGGYKLRTLGDAAGSPAWSPDSRQIAVSGPGTFYVIDLAGTIVSRPAATGNKLPLEGLSWSPDGSRLGYLRFVGGDANTPSDILLVTVRPDGTDERVIAQVGTCFCVGWGPPGFTWSPDGRQLAFVTLNFPTNGSAKGSVNNVDGELYVANADGSHMQLLTTGIPGGNPAWQPIR